MKYTKCWTLVYDWKTLEKIDKELGFNRCYFYNQVFYEPIPISLGESQHNQRGSLTDNYYINNGYKFVPIVEILGYYYEIY